MRQPFAGRSDNTLHPGFQQHKGGPMRPPRARQNVDHVHSLNDIALRDAEVTRCPLFAMCDS